ncbi:MAG TPA: hypothetical protein VFB50_12425 [Chloroflexota bacterium]|nr:hypothetical protein [Chloroflexota bacterium]
MKPQYVVTVRGQLPSNVAEQIESAHVAAVLAAEAETTDTTTPAPAKLAPRAGVMSNTAGQAGRSHAR